MPLRGVLLRAPVCVNLCLQVAYLTNKQALELGERPASMTKLLENMGRNKIVCFYCHN